MKVPFGEEKRRKFFRSSMIHLGLGNTHGMTCGNSGPEIRKLISMLANLQLTVGLS